MIDLITLPRIIICISVVGVYLVNHCRNRWGFIPFAISAALWVVYDIDIGANEQAATNAVSAVVSIYGFIRWKGLDNDNTE